MDLILLKKEQILAKCILPISDLSRVVEKRRPEKDKIRFSIVFDSKPKESAINYAATIMTLEVQLKMIESTFFG
ncbi:MAG TPA: hypothetical protein VE954_16275, partial [Oligoflexus sp.]|uniref:hypothetical protein n=1 Tax=Oligoflexus sp. TaxID=1971216 RepID=UPI002D5A63A8